jgi:hypothetical protein
MSEIELDDAVAALTVTVANVDKTAAALVLHIRDRNNVPPELADVDYPCLFPSPHGDFWREVSSTPGVFDNETGREYSQYSLNYLLALVPVGAVRGPWEVYGNALALALALKLAVRGIDLTMTKISGISISGVKVLTDAAGKSFLGCQVAISAQEYSPELE